MFVYKFSWLPWMMLLAGIGLLSDDSEEVVLPALIMIAIGSIWLYFRYKNEDSSQAVSPKNDTPALSKVIEKPVTPTPLPEKKTAKPTGKFSRHCGAKVEPDDIYCIECGEKL